MQGTLESPPPDERLARAAAGDLAAFEALYREHVGRVYAVCLRATADVGHAEALTQEVFLKAWQRLGTFRGEASLATWLRRIAVNAVCDHFRARRPEDPSDDVEGEVAPAQHAVETGVDLERAIATLPERARLVFVLHDVCGTGHAEIADRLGVTEGTSKAQLFRARRLLRERLEA